jgi:transcriptional regulator with XRE-family HTH domain
MTGGTHTPSGRPFGRHVRSLRRARGMTQEVLAERCGLSADTIRRLEHGSFSPSLDTLRKLVAGLDISLTTLFEGYEMCERNPARELIDLIAGRAPWLLALATRMLRTLFDGLAGMEAPDDKRTERGAVGPWDGVPDDVEESDDGAEVDEP